MKGTSLLKTGSEINRKVWKGNHKKVRKTATIKRTVHFLSDNSDPGGTVGVGVGVGDC